jgi:hypothetical protein
LEKQIIIKRSSSIWRALLNNYFKEAIMTNDGSFRVYITRKQYKKLYYDFGHILEEKERIADNGFVEKYYVLYRSDNNNIVAERWYDTIDKKNYFCVFAR